MIQKLILTAAFVLFSLTLFGQTNSITDKKTELKAGTYKLKQLITVMTSKGINVTYNEKAIPVENEIAVTSENPSISELLDMIKKAAPVDFTIKGDIVILKKRKSNKKFSIRGVVTNTSNEALTGASVYVKDSRYGELSNNEGSFHLRLPEGVYIIIASYVGYHTSQKSIEIAGDTEIIFSLTEEENQIDEVKITSRRNFKGNMELGRNISTIDSKKLGQLNTNNASDALQASMPGVWSTSMSGAPGDHQKVVIRGLNSLFGCTDPLYIIDGVTVPIVNLHSLGIADLNIHDIENIIVLKDASSTSLYGYQGANGVILVETKKYNNKNQISFSTKVGVQQVPGKYDLMSTRDFLTALDSARTNKISSIRQFYPEYSDTLRNESGQDKLFQNGFIREYQLMGSGNILDNKFYISGNYYNHEGIISNSAYSRYSLFTNLGRNFGKKLSASINYRTSLQKNKNNLNMYMGNNLILHAINTSPLIYSTPDTFYNNPPHTPNDNLYPNMQSAVRTYVQYRSLGSETKVDEYINNVGNTLEASSNSGNIEMKYILNDHVFFNGNSSLTFKKNVFTSKAIGNNIRSKENYLLFNQVLNCNYFKNFKNHEFTLVSGYRNYADNAYWSLDSADRIDRNETYLYNSLAINNPNGAVSRFIQSGSAHANYNFRHKYFLSLVANYENLKIDSKNVGSNLFPSVAIIWDISREPGLNQIEWLSKFNIFGNWGVSGNYPLNALAHDFFSKKSFYYPDSLIHSKALIQLANHNLKQEIIKEYNTGFNIYLFKDKLRLNADYYQKTSTNLIILRDIPSYYGGGKMFINIGKMENKGYEFSMEADILNTSSFVWSANFSFSTNKQKVINIGEQKSLVYSYYDILIPQFEIKENEELGVIKGFKYLGKWTEEDQKMQDSLSTNYPYVKDTNLKFLRNHVASKNINDSDMVVLGKSLPDFTWFFVNSFGYKNFSIEMVCYGVMGVSKYNATKVSTFIAATNRETNNFLKAGDKELIKERFYNSSYFVEDASFIRLKQLTLAYNVPKKLYKLPDLTVSVSFENLLTITKYTGYDPEATIYTDNSFSDFAVDKGAYPVPRSIFLSLNLKF